MFKKASNHADQSECVAHLAESCIALKRRLARPDADARVVAMDNVAAVARAGQIVLNLLDSWARGDEAVRQFIPQVIGLTTVTKAAVDASGRMLAKSSKLSLVLLGQFQVENCLRNIGAALGVQMSGSGFFAVAKPVLTMLGLAPSMDVMNVSALIRNSLHGNGIHHGFQRGDTVVDIGGVRYEFRHGQRVQCADWEHIAHALDASVGILGQAFAASRVEAIPEIMDQYAWEVETQPGGS